MKETFTIRKDFITVEGYFPEIGDGLAEVPTKAEYDDFRQRANAVFERLDKEVHELEDRIAALEEKSPYNKKTTMSITNCQGHSFELEGTAKQLEDFEAERKDIEDVLFPGALTLQNIRDLALKRGLTVKGYSK